jgi:hypothetical protein
MLLYVVAGLAGSGFNKFQELSEPSKPGLSRKLVLTLFGWQAHEPLMHCLPSVHPPQHAEFEIHALLQIFCPGGQVIAQAGMLDWQPYMQFEEEPETQVPFPSQVGAGWSVEPVHMAVPQEVPDALYVQAPAPLQVPSRPQGVVSVGQSEEDIVPLLIGAHVPSAIPVSVFRHDMQAPVQALLQQTPSTQALLEHSVDESHAWPLSFLATHFGGVLLSQ